MPTLLCDFYKTTFEPLKLRTRTQNTKKLYNLTLRQFAEFLNREPIIDDLTDDTVGAFLNWFKQSGRAAATTNKNRANLLALWRYAARKGLTERWPDVHPDVEPVRVPVAWTKENLERLFSGLKTLTGSVCGIPSADWWTALHLVCWDAGERISALMGAEWQHIDLSNGYLRIPAELRKGRKRDRIYRLAGDTVAAIDKIKTPERRLIFPWPFHDTYLWTKYGRILKQLNLPNDRKSKFHRMRRSVASHFEAGGGDAMALLGHSQRRVTEGYLDPRIVGEKHAIDVLFRPVPH